MPCKRHSFEEDAMPIDCVCFCIWIANDLEYGTASALENPIGCHIATDLMVGGDTYVGAFQQCVKSDNGNSCLGICADIGSIAANNDSVNTMLTEHVDDLTLAIGISVCCAKKHMISGIIQFLFDQLRDFGKKRMTYIWNNIANCLRLSAVQIAC